MSSVQQWLVVDGVRLEALPPGGAWRLGRGEGADVQLRESTASRQHAAIEPDPQGGWQVRDLGSRNGTWLDGIRLGGEPRRLADGAVVHAGGCELRFHLLPADADPQQLLRSSGASHTVSIAGRVPSSLELDGPIKGGDIKALLRFFALTGRSGVLEIFGGGEDVRIQLADGRPVGAAGADNLGFAALRQAIHRPGDRFRFRPGAMAALPAAAAIDPETLDQLRAAEGGESHDRARAVQVQRHLLRPPPEIPGWGIAVHSVPRSGVGGDLYEIALRPDGSVLVFLGDVAGHGVSSAIAMAAVLTSLRRHAGEADGRDILIGLNRDVCADLLPGQFVTAWLGILDPASGRIQAWQAGHHAPVVIAGTSRRRMPSEPGMALGVGQDGLFANRLRSVVMDLEPGDTLVQFSDGLIEARLPDGRFIDAAQVASLAAVEGLGEASAAATIRRLTAGLGQAEIADDLTILALHRIADGSAEPHGEAAVSGPRRGTRSEVTTRPATPQDLTALVGLPRRRIGQRSGEGCDLLLGQVVGEGGMGIVHLARQRGAERDVALKRLAPGHASPGERMQFLTEAMVLANLPHPRIAPIYDVGEDPDTGPFYTMPLLSGSSLEDALGTAAEERLLDIVEAVAEAISFAHHRGIIHRDIKPANILLGPFGEIYVMDWGLAAAAGQIPAHLRGILRPPRPRQVVGTPAYMAPEQAAGDELAVGPATDVYLLGGLLLHVLTGRMPHEGSSVQACIAAARANLLPPLDEHQDLHRLAARALATAPADRFPSAEAFRAALAACRQGWATASLVREAERELALAPNAPGFTGFERAIHGFEQVLRIDPQRADARAGLSRARAAYADAAISAGEIEGAERILDPADPAHADAWSRIRSMRAERVASRERLRALEAEVERRWTACIDETFDADWKERWIAPDASDAPFALAPDGGIAGQASAPVGVYWRHAVVGDQSIFWEGAISARTVGQLVLFVEGTWNSRFGPSQAPRLWIHLNSSGLIELEHGGKVAAWTRRPDLVRQEERLTARLERVGNAVRAWVQGEPLFDIDAMPGLDTTVGASTGFFIRNLSARCRRVRIEQLSGARLMQTVDLAERFMRNGNLAAMREMIDIAESAGEAGPRLDRMRSELVRHERLVAERDAVERSLAAIWPSATVKVARHGYDIQLPPGAADLAPLRSRPVSRLVAIRGSVDDLAPLSGMPLSHLDLTGQRVHDLSPLHGMRFAALHLAGNRVADPDQFEGIDAESLQLSSLPLDRLPGRLPRGLRQLNISGTRISDLRPLAGHQLAHLHMMDAPVDDLAPVLDQPIRFLNLCNTGIHDLRRAVDLPLDVLTVGGRSFHRMQGLKDLKVVTFCIVDVPNLDFKPVTGLVFRELILVNTGIDDLEGLVGSDFRHISLKNCAHVRSIAGLAARLPDLRQCTFENSPITDLAGLAGAGLIHLTIIDCPVADLSPLRGMPLRKLRLVNTRVADLSPILGCPLDTLEVRGSPADVRTYDLPPAWRVISDRAP